jgi:hypothetical protein
VAFECTVPGEVSTCVAPLLPDLTNIDLSRLSVPALGTIGPHAPNGQIVGLISASAPTLLNYHGRLFLYWAVDYFGDDSALPQNHLATRGMELEEDPKKRLWGKGSLERSVSPIDPRLTSLVMEVTAGDPTADHVAALGDAHVVGSKIVGIFSIGGTGGTEVCRRPRDISPGCWRVLLSVANVPLGNNVFAQHELPAVSLPSNAIEYPRLIVDPEGRNFLFGNFIQTKAPAMQEQRILYPSGGVGYIPFDLARLVNVQ